MKTTFSFEQQWGILESLGSLEVKYRGPLSMKRASWIKHSFYATISRVEVGGDGALSSVLSDGDSPEEAVNNLFERLTDLPDRQYVVLNAYSKERRQMRWNGYSFVEVF